MISWLSSTALDQNDARRQTLAARQHPIVCRSLIEIYDCFRGAIGRAEIGAVEQRRQVGQIGNHVMCATLTRRARSTTRRDATLLDRVRIGHSLRIEFTCCKEHILDPNLDSAKFL